MSCFKRGLSRDHCLHWHRRRLWQERWLESTWKFLLLFSFPIFFSLCIPMDRSTLMTLFSTPISWLGGIVAHIVAIVLAPLVVEAPTFSKGSDSKDWSTPSTPSTQRTGIFERLRHSKDTHSINPLSYHRLLSNWLPETPLAKLHSVTASNDVLKVASIRLQRLYYLKTSIRGSRRRLLRNGH